MRTLTIERLPAVHDKPIDRAQDAEELIRQAIETLTDELNAIIDPAPPGVWLVRPLKKSPQYRWESGSDSRGRPKTRSQSISFAEASTWERRRSARERKQKLEIAIDRLEAVLFDLKN